MSGTRLTRKVTVEGSKKLPESGGQSSGSSSGTRRSVFDRLGPGTSDREARPRSREPYPPEKCRNWLRDGRCQFGRNCKFLHGPFSEPKQRTKSVRSIVRSDVDRSEERDEGGMGGRTRSMDSLEAEDEDEREIPIKKKKSRHFEESGDTGKKSEKLKRRQHVEKASSSRSEDEEEEEDEHRKRRKKLKKRQLSGGVVITKPRNPEQEERDWGDEENEERRNELDWEERGELDFERQLNLEKRRQDLQRQLALMDEEEAVREIDDRKVKEPKKDRDEEHKPVIPVVHSKLHPEKSSVSPGDEFSPVSSQSTPKKKKKKTDGEPKKVKIKHKLSPAAKELKKRKGIKLAAEGLEAGAVQDRTRKLMLSPEASKLNILPEKREFEVVVGEKSRAVKKKQLKTKLKEGNILKSPEDAYLSPSDLSGRRPQRTSSAEEIPRDKSSFSPEEQRPLVEKVRRRAALSSPEGSDSPSLRYPSEPDRNRRIADPSEGSPRKHVRDIHVAGPPGESDYKPKVKGYLKHYKLEGSPGTPEQGRREVVKDMRHVEEGQVERRKIIVDEPPPRSPSPEDIPARGPITPLEEQRRRRTPPRVDRRGPQTPPGEPEHDNDAVKHAASDRATSRQLGPYTPPPPTTPPVRTRVDKNREEIYEGRPESVPYRDDLPRNKERSERETRYPKPRGVEGGDEPSRGGRGHPPTDEDFPKSRVRDEELSRGRHRDDRQEDHHQRGRPKDDRADEFHRVGEQPERSRLDEPKGDELPRRKGEGDDEYLRRRDERDDDHFRGRNREPDKDDERQRRRDERNDEHPRGRVRDEHEEDLQRPRGRDIPRRQFEGGDDRHLEGRGDRDSREAGQFTDRGDRRRTDIPPRQDMPDNRGRERPDERPRDREGRHPPPGPDYHRRTSPIPHGPRRSPPPHGPPRGPHRFMERRRSLSPGGRREEGNRPGPPRDQGGYGMGREPVRGRGGYTVPFDNRGRPMDDGRRRNSPPPRQYMERGRGTPRGRGGRVGRGFPDRMRPPGDRYQEPLRDRGAPWDPERRREREHPRDRSRPHDESRDRDRRPRGELSPGRGPKHWEEKKSGSPGRGSSPPRDRRAHEQEKMPREVEEDRRRRSDDEEEEWEYEEDMGEEKDKVPRQRERKRARETTSSVSTIESPVGGKRRRSETPEMEEAAIPDAVEHGDKASTGTPTRQAPASTGTPTKQAPVSTGTPTKQAPASSGTPTKQTTKIKKKKLSKKEGKVPKPEGVASLEGKMPQETALESEGQLEGERQPKGEKKHKKDKGKSKEKATKKKKKNSTVSSEEIEVATELSEEPTNVPEEGEAVPSEHVGEVAQPAEDEPITKLGKKRRHADVPEGEEIKTKGADKPPKKKKKKKHQPEVVVQPWADLEGDYDETNANKSENNERQESDKDVQPVQGKEREEHKSSDGVTDENQDSSKVDEPLTVFSDWSDDSPIGDDSWSDINEPEIAEDKPKACDKERDNVQAASPVENSAPAYDDVYDPISDDELDAMLGDEEEEDGVGSSGAAGLVSAPMAVEDVDWSALVSTPGAAEKTGEEPGSYLKRFTPGHVFSRIGISSSLAGPRLTKLVQQACAKATNDNLPGVETVDSNDAKGTGGLQVRNSIGALMAGAAAKRRERQMLFTDVGPCRRALCARKDLAMRKRLQRLTGKVGLFQTPPTAPVDNELYLMSVALYKHEHTSTDSSVTKLIPSRVGTVLTTVNS